MAKTPQTPEELAAAAEAKQQAKQQSKAQAREVEFALSPSYTPPANSYTFLGGADTMRTFQVSPDGYATIEMFKDNDESYFFTVPVLARVGAKTTTM